MLVASLLASGLQQPLSKAAPVTLRVRAPSPFALAGDAYTSRRALLSSVAALGAVGTVGRATPAWAGYVHVICMYVCRAHAHPRGRLPATVTCVLCKSARMLTIEAASLELPPACVCPVGTSTAWGSRRRSRRTRRKTASSSPPSPFRTVSPTSRTTSPPPRRSRASSRARRPRRAAGAKTKTPRDAYSRALSTEFRRATRSWREREPTRDFTPRAPPASALRERHTPRHAGRVDLVQMGG